MKLRLDKSGRIVLPKPLRRRLGLRAGSIFEASESAEGLLLAPVTHRPSLVEREGFLVHTGQPARDLDWQQLSDDLREESSRHILGW